MGLAAGWLCRIGASGRRNACAPVFGRGACEQIAVNEEGLFDGTGSEQRPEGGRVGWWCLHVRALAVQGSPLEDKLGGSSAPAFSFVMRPTPRVPLPRHARCRSLSKPSGGRCVPCGNITAVEALDEGLT